MAKQLGKHIRRSSRSTRIERCEEALRFNPQDKSAATLKASLEAQQQPKHR